MSVPKYIYKTNKISVLLELYRYAETKKFISEISKQIDWTTKKYRLPRIYMSKVWIYFGQMIMDIITERTDTDGDVYLDDGLFNESTGDHINNFYNDLNYRTNSEVFKSDSFGIKNWIKQMIKNIHNIQVDEEIEPFTVSTTHDTVIFKIITSLLKQCSPMLNFGTIYKHAILEFSITSELYQRVQRRFTLDQGFHNLLLCCLIRYETLGSGANQFMVDLEYKRQLQKLGMNFECFASPFNCYFDFYSSMFYDLEQYFGSSGSFMALTINPGMYMANPPYSIFLLYKMYDKIKANLNPHVTFIMSIPKWENFPLEHQIEADHLYRLRVVKHEKFHDPYKNLAMYLIPEYISYLFMSEENEDLETLFLTYRNIWKKN